LRDSSHSYKREQFISCYSIYFLEWTILALNSHSQTHVDTFQVSHILFLLFLLLFVLKIEELLCRIIKDFIYSYATTSSSCLLPLFILLLFFHFFSHLILLAEQLKQQFMTIIIHYMNIFLLHLLLFPLRVYNLSMHEYMHAMSST